MGTMSNKTKSKKNKDSILIIGEEQLKVPDDFIEDIQDEESDKTAINIYNKSRVTLDDIFSHYVSDKPTDGYILAAQNYVKCSISEKFFVREGDYINYFKLKDESEIEYEDKDDFVDAQIEMSIILLLIQETESFTNLYSRLSAINQRAFYIKFILLIKASEINDEIQSNKIIYCSDLILKEDPYNEEGNLNKGYALLKLAKYSEAEENFTKVLDNNNKDYEAWLGVAEAFKHQDKYNDAVDSYNRVLFNDSTNTGALYGLGYCLLKRGDFSRAKIVFNDYEKINPEGMEGKKLAIAIDFLLEDFADAFWKLNLLDNDQKISALYWTCEQAEFHESYNICLISLDYLIKLDRSNNFYFHARSKIYKKFGDFLKAANAYKKYLDLLEENAPSSVNIQNKKDIVSFYKRLGNYREAINIVEDSISIDTNGNDINNILFSLYYLQGHKDKAYTYLDSLTHWPKFYSLEILLKDCLKLKKYEEIDVISGQMLDLYDGSILAHFAKLIALIKKIEISNNNIEDARSLMSRISDIGKERPELLIMLIHQLSKIWETISDITDLDRIILKSINLKLDFMSSILKYAKFVALWEIERKLAFDYYMEDSEVRFLFTTTYQQVAVIATVKYPSISYFTKNIRPDIKSYAFERVQNIINNNQRYSTLNKFYKKIVPDFVLKECNEIIERFDLYRTKALVISPDEIKDQSQDVGPGIVLVERGCSGNIYNQGISKNGEDSEQKNIKYDILYYSFDGSKSLLDYTRSFIGENTDISFTNVPAEILNNYNIISRSLCGEKKSSKPPEAIKIPTEIKVHNQVLIDNYAWMRDSHKYEDILNQLIDSENQYLDKYLENEKENMDFIIEEMKSRMNLEHTTPLADTIAGYDYFISYIKDKDFPICYRQKEGSELDYTKAELVLDFNKMNDKKPIVSVSGIFFSEKHNMLAYGLDYSGNELFEIRIVDLTTLQEKSDVITKVLIRQGSTYSNKLIWHKSICGFLYFDGSKDKIRFHKIGDDQDNDTSLNIKHKNSISRIGFKKSANGELVIISNNHKIEKNELYIISLIDDFIEAKKVITNDGNFHYSMDQSGDYIYVRINDKGNNFRIIRTMLNDLSDPDFSDDSWEEFISHDKKRYIDSFYVSENFLILNYLRKGNPEIEIVRIDDKKSKKVEFSTEAPIAYGFVSDFASDCIDISYLTFLGEGIRYSYDFDTNTISIIGYESIKNVNKKEYEIKRVWAENKGVKVPISLCYKKSLMKKDGSNPVFICGYGSYGEKCYGIEHIPYVYSLLDRGFIFAIAHVRGGGELGYDWWDGARGVNQKNKFLDFISCGEYLIQENYTSAGNIVSYGGSAGGTLVAVSANLRPDLFKIIIPSSPRLDFCNLMLKSNCDNNCSVFEAGNPKEKKYFESILMNCPYWSIKKGNYPSVYIMNGMNDRRVSCYESLKFSAKIREFKTNKSNIFVRTKMNRGHLPPTSEFEVIDEVAEKYIFILKEFGIKVDIENKKGKIKEKKSKNA